MNGLVLAILAAAATTASPPDAADGHRPLVPSITVVGEGKVSAKPDQAEVQVGVVTHAATASQALKENNAAMERLLKLLAARGIAEKDVQTSSFQVIPQYRQDKEGREQPEPAGYQVANLVRVKIRDLAKLGSVLDEGVNQGANRVQGISFSVGNPEPLLDEARGKAIADARRKAELFAKAAGRKSGRVLLIQEQGAQFPQQAFLGAAMEKAAAVPIALGELDLQANISVTFALE